MNTIEHKKPLMKHFSAVFRRRALATTEVKETISPLILKFFSRKELIHIIKDKYDGSIPKEYDLMELENVDLLTIIEDDIFIISYMTKQWCEDRLLHPVEEVKTDIDVSKTETIEGKNTVDKNLIKKMDTVISKSVSKQTVKKPNSNKKDEKKRK